MSDVPDDPVRDADIMEHADHLDNQMKDRNVLWGQIVMAIEDGSVEDAKGDHNKGNVRYRLEIPGVDLLVGVDTTKGQYGRIASVYYDDEQGAEEGSLGGRKFGQMLGGLL